MFALVRSCRLAVVLSLIALLLVGMGTSVRADSGADDGEYASPDFKVTLTYDAELWSVKNDVSADENDGRDELRLINGDTNAVLYLETYDGYNGKAGDCIDGAVSEVTGDAKTTAIKDRRGNTIEGSEKGITWASYTFKDSDGTKLATFVECRALPKAAGVFVVSLITTPDNFDSDYRDVQDILDTVDLGASTSSGKTNTGKPGPGGDKTPTATAGNGKASTGDATQVGEYLTVEVPADWTVREFGPDSFSEGGSQLFNLTSLTSVMLFTVSPDIADMGVQEMLDTYADISSKSLGQKLTLAQFEDGTDATTVEDNRGYAMYSFEDMGLPTLLYVNIQVMKDGRAIVFAASAPQQLFDQLFDETLATMMNSITYLG